MDYSTRNVFECGSATIVNYLPEIGLEAAIEEIITGLHARPRRISSKYFYDKKGSKLFENITVLDEYYPSRTEKAILRMLPLGAITDCSKVDIVELGSGDHSKITLFLDKIPVKQMQGVRYFPVDISRPALEASIKELACMFPGLAVQGIIADYIHQMHIVSGERKKLYCFLGSTIGNLDRGDAMQFVRDISDTMNPGDRFLIGFDRVKDVQILENAYNDAQGLTAQFNRNILNVINRLIESDFDTEDFEHRAFYNRAEQRIEMHLEAITDVCVKTPFAAENILIRKGERIHTENSHKFEEKDIQLIGEHAELAVNKIFSDENQWFSLVNYKKIG
ncbi:L-histidine N(alpha)-methyltransferase [Prosthecochloris sp. SCSIO W1101]|uniref:L-histidine N(alpha)-methyltransferase n=1 Tax=Prosthecochloris sp. SCSIO W1101 TaxID=2992242 RepID=UPI00223E474A|nr:L-histidine N(alpha)-methyltransferase [Prosthecochloris sp. SCSIO W1101]UZJ42505.1 L-histidine N(alpha)-methyltransferase [Prosthecochloris sp. SCSIO W1101]